MSNYLKNIIIIAVILIGILFYYISFDGYYFYDDTTYLKYAFQISKGTFQLTNDNFCNRFGLILPIAILYKLLSINDFSSTLYPLLCWLGSVFLCIKVLKNNIIASVLAVIFCGLDYYHIFFINKVYPDMPVAFFIMLSLYILQKQLFNENEKSYLNAFLFSLNFFIGFISKTTAIYILPFYAIIFFVNLKNKQNIRFWKSTLICSISLFFAYLVIYYLKTGNAIYIFSNIENSHYESALSYSNKGFWVMFNRLTIGPILLFINSGMIIPLVCGLVYMCKSKMNQINEITFWCLASISILLMFWFSSMSFTFYQPMSLNARMIILLAPPLAIWAGLSLQKLIEDKTAIFTLTIIFIIISILCFKFVQPSKSVIYILISFSFVNLIFSKNATFLIVGILISLCIQPIYSMSKPKIYAYKEEKELFDQYLLQFKNQNITIVSDDRMVHGGTYFLKFATPSNWEFIRFKDLKINTQKQNVYIIVNEEYCCYLNEKIKIDSTNIKLIINKNNKVKLYKLINQKSLH